MGKRVICYIQAFDCEKTIEAAMRSVLEQTYENWICFVLSNGNQNTAAAPNWSFDIIKSFAAKDRRFVVLNKRENDLHLYIPMLYYLAGRFADSYICLLDADDEYQRDFFERGVSFAQAHELDIVACGTEIILKKDAEEKSGVLLSRREIPQNRVIKKADFTKSFPHYKPFFNEMWGKLYRTELLRNGYDWGHAERHFYGHFLPDTLFTIDTLSKSAAIGILSGTSHKFYQYTRRPATNATAAVNSLVAGRQLGRRLFSNSRYSVYDTYETVLSFLRAHGEISEELTEYMNAVLFGWFSDFYARTLLPTQDEKRFAKLAARLIFHPKFDEVMCYQDSGKYDNLRNYEQRIKFCELLRDTLLGQIVIRNRRLLWKGNLPCSFTVRREFDQLTAKLEHMVRLLSNLQRKEE